MKRTAEDEAEIRKMQDLAENYTGVVRKIPMGKRMTRSKTCKHIGVMKNVGNNKWVALSEQSQRWNEERPDHTDNLLWGAGDDAY
jgi:hypothetical protein